MTPDALPGDRQWAVEQGDSCLCPKCGQKLDLQVQRKALEVRDEETNNVLGWWFPCEHCGAELVQTREALRG